MWSKQIYQFERKLDGGTVKGLPGFTYINERVVRNLGLEHGDLVRPVNRLRLNEGFSYRYEFELVEKRPKPLPDRIQVNGLEVVENGYLMNKGEFYQINGCILRIKEKCKIRFNLLVGDIVDIAIPKNNPYKFKVIWKHE